MDQLDLFADAAAPDEEQLRLIELRQKLPDLLRLGTSSWTFPGWKGRVYRRHYPTQTAFVREALREYAQYPLFRTVGVDRTYYAPVNTDDFVRYAKMLPDDFRSITKVFREVTTHCFSNHPKEGRRAGQLNPNFLSAEFFETTVLDPLRQSFAKHQGPLIFQMPRSPQLRPRQFLERLAEFLVQTNSPFPLLFELRDARLMTPQYADLLRKHSAGHVYSFWSDVPGLSEQRQRLGTFNTPAVVRLLLPPSRTYASAKASWSPFSEIAEPNIVMRQEAVSLVRSAIEHEKETYLVVNNKAEGCSPLTVEAIATLLTQ